MRRLRDARLLLPALLIALISAALSGCISDAISTSPSDLLSFSRDTVSFDTVFTDLGTPTARLIVHNRNKKGVNISSIRFRKSDSNFTLNVDGVSGRDFHDVEIRGRDSIYVFIECFIPETQGSKPSRVEDELLFVTNGVEQSVTVEAYGQNVTRLRGVRLESDMTLTAEQPYVIFDSLSVEPGATLRIEPGAQVLFHDKASLKVRGRLEAVGEAGKMIQLRGDRLDDVLTDVGYDILAGQWDGVTIEAGSFDNRMEYVDMRSTVRGLQVDSCGVLDRSKLTLVNSWIHNSQQTAFRSAYSNVDAYGCVFSEAAEASVRLTGGEHTFTQCTISNYYLFSAITEPLLSLYHVLPEDAKENSQPLMRANFENCIIYGLGTDMNCGDLTGADVYLRNVLLKSKGTDDANFISCLWGEDPLFMTVREDYIFNYRVKEGSPAIGAGNAAFVTKECLIDMDGVDRLRDGAPTLGAYAFTW